MIENYYTKEEYDLIQFQKAKWQSSGIAHMTRRSFMIRLMGGARGKRILDYGCGVGTLLRELSEESSTICHGLDNNAMAIRIARKGMERRKNLRFLVGTAEKDGLPDHFYDAIVCMETLEHIEDEDGAISFFRRKLRKDGCVVLTVPSFTRITEDPNHYRYYRREDLRKAFERNGFRTCCVRSYGFPLLEAALLIFMCIYNMRKKDEGKVGHYSYGGIKKFGIYHRLLPLLKLVLRFDELFGRTDLGFGVIGKFKLR